MANIDAYSAAESWIKLNLKEDPNQQLPKHGCYMAYVKCMLNQNILTIPNSDFGKIVKCQFRNVRSKRYGPWGSNSNYYSGITLSSSSIPGNPSSYQIPPPPLTSNAWSLSNNHSPHTSLSWFLSNNHPLLPPYLRSSWFLTDNHPTHPSRSWFLTDNHPPRTRSLKLVSMKRMKNILPGSNSLEAGCRALLPGWKICLALIKFQIAYI